MTIKVGDKLPTVTLMRMGADGPEPVSSDTLFKGRKVALFAVPGAFTPTCSAAHLPGFIKAAEEFRAHGVNDVVCVAVNDVFVMDAWGKAQKAEGKVAMIADGSGDFAKAVGLELDLRDKGLGMRSQRYSALVEDGVVKTINVEKPGAFEVSKAERLLEQL